MIDLFNREIVGYASGPNKDAQLFVKAFSCIKNDIESIRLFHSDQGNPVIVIFGATSSKIKKLKGY